MKKKKEDIARSLSCVHIGHTNLYIYTVYNEFLYFSLALIFSFFLFFSVQNVLYPNQLDTSCVRTNRRMQRTNKKSRPAHYLLRYV